MRILIFEDDPEEQVRAREAAESAGHEVKVLGSFSDEELRAYDGVVTDLYFPVKRRISDKARETGNLFPMGIMVVIDAMHSRVPVVICTNLDHHGAEASWIYDCYVSTGEWRVWHVDNSDLAPGLQALAHCPFGWHEMEQVMLPGERHPVRKKDWKGSIKELEIRASWPKSRF